MKVTILLLTVILFSSCNSDNEKVKSLQDENQTLREQLKLQNESNTKHEKQLNPKDSIIKSSKNKDSITTDNKKLYTKDEFQKKFYMKSKEYVIKILGKADQHHTYSEEEELCYYQIINDPYAKRPKNVCIKFTNANIAYLVSYW